MWLLEDWVRFRLGQNHDQVERWSQKDLESEYLVLRQEYSLMLLFLLLLLLFIYSQDYQVVEQAEGDALLIE